MTTKQTKKKTFHDGHIKLWGDLAKNGSDDKSSSSVWKDPEYDDLITMDIEKLECFACHNKINDDCSRCPIRWTKKKKLDLYGYYCLEEGALFDKWLNCNDVIRRKALAAQIRDLPWKEKKP